MNPNYSNYEFFWNGPFSQWAKFPMVDDHGIRFNCCEQYMMYKKAMVFKDEETAAKVLTTLNPRDQKKLGRQVKNFDDKVWDAVKYEIVFTANMLKFTQNEDAKEALMATEDRILVEASPYDAVWGIGLDEANAQQVDPDKWPGQNLLGKAITSVKAVL